MAERTVRGPNPIAYFVFAGVWLALGVWTIATPTPALNQWLQLAAHLALAAAFAFLGTRRVRPKGSFTVQMRHGPRATDRAHVRIEGTRSQDDATVRVLHAVLNT
ncbi:hypothetical protein [Amnibacterium setariae]|uniref:Uncharacterized protein n=1 Tax=Amnibacterium setariae TaxID=2306585 RepID=A0A3A1TZ23_9MICO|nr:hypothetical protein [Amnibacterium setariae]RIX29965.1 hypothetical protein D1781_00335 [Amnibacterium setariae]